MVDPYVQDHAVEMFRDAAGNLYLNGQPVESIRFITTEVTTRVMLYSRGRFYFVSKHKYDTVTSSSNQSSYNVRAATTRP